MDMLKNIKKYWEKITEGWFGYIVYALLGVILAYSINFIFGLILNTKLPLVVIVSSSMSHSPGYYICGSYVKSYKNSFENYWMVCNESYKAFNITKEIFLKFPFKNGMEVGDVIVVKKEKNYKLGDVIVYQPTGGKYPIIHRIVKINEDGSFQTKGDRNNGQFNYEKRINYSQIYGKAILRIPLIGWPRVLVMMVMKI
ncbi:MAG: signal peptidase I [Candidatus Aenigmatarchaeota archaeon]